MTPEERARKVVEFFAERRDEVADFEIEFVAVCRSLEAVRHSPKVIRDRLMAGHCTLNAAICLLYTSDAADE